MTSETISLVFEAAFYEPVQLSWPFTYALVSRKPRTDACAVPDVDGKPALEASCVTLTEPQVGDDGVKYKSLTVWISKIIKKKSSTEFLKSDVLRTKSRLGRPDENFIRLYSKNAC